MCGQLAKVPKKPTTKREPLSLCFSSITKDLSSFPVLFLEMARTQSRLPSN